MEAVAGTAARPLWCLLSRSDRRATASPAGRRGRTLELLELRLHGGAEVDLRLRRRQLLVRLAAGDDLLRRREGGDEGTVPPQRRVDEGVAEISEIILVAAAERGLVRRCGGEN